MAFVLMPQPPLASWFAELDDALCRSAGFFVGRPVVVDLTGVSLCRPDLAQLIVDLQARDIRVLGIEGVDPSLLGLGLPPPLKCGRVAGSIDMLKTPRAGTSLPKRSSKPSSLLLQEPVRSGQSVFFPAGDVTVVGSVASGAEVVAGGSIHIYGTLRGRALAGANGNAGARIFCRKNEAELLAIDGVYQTADDMGANFRGQAVQARLECGTLVITALN
jgi:septum site-determining protein MinC